MFHPSICSPPFEDTTFETVEGSIVESDNISYEVFYYMCNACQMSCHMPFTVIEPIYIRNSSNLSQNMRIAC
jgi:hypothetical protein